MHRVSGSIELAPFDFDTLREGPTLHVVIEHQSSVDYSMPLRFLNYTSLLYQRLYRDRTRWSKGDTADPVLHVVVYNGDSRWDAPGPSKTVRRSSR